MQLLHAVQTVSAAALHAVFVYEVPKEHALHAMQSVADEAPVNGLYFPASHACDVMTGHWFPLLQ